MDKRTIIIIIVFAFFIGGIVGYKLLFNSKAIMVGKEFSIQKDEMATIKTDDMTKVKLISINPIDGCTLDGECNGGLEFVLQINGENYTVSSIPSTIDMYNAYELLIVDGDEDHIVLNTQRK